MERSKSYLKRNSSSEYKDVEKYFKFFAIKALQCVVQSRVGSKCKTRCNPSAKGLDWFNMSLPDGDANSKLQGRIRDIFGKKIPGFSAPICVDIILKTAEGSLTVLETWQIMTDERIKSDTMKNSFSIYNRLGVLLKSVLSIGRLLPSYHLSRKSQQDFTLYCKLHIELHQLHNYELHNQIDIGSVVSPLGKISIKVLYRNKIWLSGSMQAHTYVINNMETLFSLTSDKERSSFQSVDMFENEIALAASDIGTVLPDWFSPLSSTSSELDMVFKNSKKRVSPEKQMIVSGPTVGHMDEKSRPIAAFVEPSTLEDNGLPNLELPTLSSTPPFLSLLHEPNKEPQTTAPENNKDKKMVDVKHERNDSPTLLQRRAEAVGFEDDFVLVELRPAFSIDDDSVGMLFRQCQSPEALDIFSSLEKEDNESECIDLDTQLEKYRQELNEFQNFFKVLN